MAASKLTKDDAREMLDALGQQGEGWARGVALAIRMNAPKALGMDRREFTDRLGVRMGRSVQERRQMILDLKGEGLSGRAISDVLGISPNTVNAVLADEGLAARRSGTAGGAVGGYEMARQKQIGAARADQADQTGAARAVDGTAADLDAENEDLRRRLERAEAEAEKERDKAEKAAEARKKAQDKVKELQADQLKAEREEMEADQKAMPLAEAKAEEAARAHVRERIDALGAEGTAAYITGVLDDLAGRLTSVARHLSDTDVQQIRRALDALAQELVVAEAMAEGR